MSYNIEFLGPPGSGKTYFFNKLIYDLKKKKLNIKKPKDIIILNYLKANTDVSYVRKLGYYFYFKKIKVKSNRIFKREYNSFIKYINSYIKKDTNIKSVMRIYNKYLTTANYSLERKKRMRINFLIDYFGTKMNMNKKRANFLEEGFFQKIFLNFSNKKNKISPDLLIKYLKYIPQPDLLLFINTDLKICLERIKNRKDGFLYNFDNISYLDNKESFNDFIIDYAKKKNIKVIKINNNKFNKKKYLELFSHIMKKIKK